MRSKIPLFGLDYLQFNSMLKRLMILGAGVKIEKPINESNHFIELVRIRNSSLNMMGFDIYECVIRFKSKYFAPLTSSKDYYAPELIVETLLSSRASGNMFVVFSSIFPDFSLFFEHGYYVSHLSEKWKLVGDSIIEKLKLEEDKDGR